jgi:hypothetical protein
VKKLKPKTCRACKEQFTPWTSLQVCCSPKCAIEHTREKKRKAFKAETRKMKIAHNLTDRKHQLKEAQKAFNAFIRERDRDQPCIDCGTYFASKWDAGHYKTRGAYPELAFSELNCHKQCSQCNQHGQKGTAAYRVNLVERIGLANVEWLEGPHERLYLSLTDIIQVKKTYQEKLKALQSSG